MRAWGNRSRAQTCPEVDPSSSFRGETALRALRLDDALFVGVFPRHDGLRRRKVAACTAQNHTQS